jgi:ABC-2 type transport system ATP-binding protein
VIEQLRQRGRTVLLTTHYMEEAERLCDRVAVMDHGCILTLDSPAALIRRHFEASAIEFLNPDAYTHAQMAALPGVSQVVFQNGNIILFSLDIPRTMAGLFELQKAQGVGFQNMTVRQATLEDVFLKLTGRRIRS